MRLCVCGSSRCPSLANGGGAAPRGQAETIVALQFDDHPEPDYTCSSNQ